MADKELISQIQQAIRSIEEGAPLEETPEAACTTPASDEESKERPRRKYVADKQEERSDDAAFKKVVALINASEKSEKTIRERLAKDGFAEGEIELAIERAKRYAIIDDSRYAELLIRSRLSQGKGRVGIQRELEANGIDPDLYDFSDDDGLLDDETEVNRAIEVLRRKPPRSKNLRDGAFRKLMQRGYSTNVASTAARQWVESLGGVR